MFAIKFPDFAQYNIYNVCFVIKMHSQMIFFPRYKNTHLAGKYTATSIIEAYHLEAISHHSAPNWTVCLLHFHFLLSTLSASLWDRPEKWHSLRLIEHPRAQTKLTELRTRAMHGHLDSLLLLRLLVKERCWQKQGQEEGGFCRNYFGENLSTSLLKATLLNAVVVKYVVRKKTDKLL